MKKEVLPVKKDESLFALVAISHQIQQGLVESMGELTPDIEKALDVLSNKLPDKADGYKFVIDDLKAQADLWNERAATLTRIAKTFITYTDRMKYSLKMACINLGVEELVGKDFKWKLVNNAASLIVDNPDVIPSEFIEIVQTKRVRSDLLKEALKAGKTVPGARLETGSHVRSFVNKGSK